MFAPRTSPLKEGRSHPGLPYAGSLTNGRGRFTPRQIALALILIICVPIFFYIHSSGDSALLSGGGSIRQKMPTAVDLSDKVKSAIDPNVLDHIPTTEAVKASVVGHKDVQDTEHVASQPKPQAAEDVSTKVATNDDDDDIPRKPASKALLPPSTTESWSERPQFERALERVVNMLPDEVHMRELIRDVDSTGKERLREMGLRTRQYKKYFEAWEALHMTEDEEGGTYVRDDVLQYLRSHVHTGAGHRDDSGSTLSEMSLASTMHAYEAYRSFLQKFAQLLFPWTMPYFSDHMSLHAHFKKGGRGIVLTAGDNQAPFILTTIVTFRQLGCDLPIEVMYLGDQDLGEDYRAELEALDGVTTRDIAQMVNDEGWRLAGWAAKPFAILLSSFREVIFIDADSLFFRNPASLFDEPGYKKTGALFFKDRMIMPENKKRFLQQILPKPIPKLAKESRYWTGESGHMQESGVVVVDKWQHFIPLLLVTRLNGPDRDGNKEQGRIGVYDLMYGRFSHYLPKLLYQILTPMQVIKRHSGSAGFFQVTSATTSTKVMPVSWDFLKIPQRQRKRLIEATSIPNNRLPLRKASITRSHKVTHPTTTRSVRHNSCILTSRADRTGSTAGS